MTISSTTRKTAVFSGNDVTQIFAFTFKVLDADDVYVVTVEDGAETIEAQTTDYTVSLNADQNVSPGGSITRLVALPTGTSLMITTNQEELQPVNVQNAGGFYPAVFNNAFDRLTIMVQQLSLKAARALKLPITDGGTAVVPSATDRAGKLLGFDDDGNLTALTFDSSGTVAASASWLSTLLGTVASGWSAAFGTTFSLVVREKLTANRDYYVDKTNGVGNGLASGASAFGTIAQAYAATRKLDFNGYRVRWLLSADTYTDYQFISGPFVGQQDILDPFNPGSDFQIVGAGQTSTIWNVTGTACVFFTNGARGQVKSMELRNTGTLPPLVGLTGAQVGYDDIKFGPSAYGGWLAQSGARVTGSVGSAVGCTLAPGGSSWPRFALAEVHASGYLGTSLYTVVGAPVWTDGFLVAGQHSQIGFEGTTFSGAATGPRVRIDNGGIINDDQWPTTLSALPGSTDGTHESEIRTFISDVTFEQDVQVDGQINATGQISGATFAANIGGGAFAQIDAAGHLVLRTYTVAGLPSAVTYARAMIYVSDETGGATLAFSDGANWRRVSDRAIVS